MVIYFNLAFSVNSDKDVDDIYDAYKITPI